MVIIISYNKQTWNEYSDSQTADENLANGAIISADRLNHMETGISNNDINKVTDNKDGTEQLNGIQVQPFNKLSDTVGGRNLLINTAKLNDSTVCLDTESNISDTYLGLNIYQTNTAWSGVRIYWSYLAPRLRTDTNYVMSEYVRNTSPTTPATIGMFENNANTGNGSGIVYNNFGFSTTLSPNSEWTRISALINIASFPTNIVGKLRFENVVPLTDGYVQFAGLKLEQGSIATDWTPASEDKVNVSDMRKPASDVAGIEEVNAKQDKLTITPADDSKVVHTADTSSWQKSKVTDDTGMPLLMLGDTDDLSAKISGLPNGYFTIYCTGKTLNNPSASPKRGIIHITATRAGSGILFSEDKNAYIITLLNGVTYTQLANDSLVAHLSGANNFDTVPTYGTNNKPFAINDTGATTARPTGQAVGYQYFDTTLNKPIWYNGSKWVDSTGTTV